MTTNHRYLLDTGLMKRSRREIWGRDDSALQRSLAFTAEGERRTNRRRTVGARPPYGPRKHRVRWFDMGAKLPDFVLTGQYELTEATRAVLYVILHDLRPDGEVRVAYAAIAAYAGVSKRTAERAVRVLERYQLIQVVRGGWSNVLNRKVVNIYRIADSKLRRWWASFFGKASDKFFADPLTSKIPVSTARQREWGAASEAQTKAAAAAATALGLIGDPWDVARELLFRHSYKGMPEHVALHRYDALLAVLHIELRLRRDASALKNPRGFLVALLSKKPGAYHPCPSIYKELTAIRLS